MSQPDLSKLNAHVDSLRGELVRVLSDLVRIPTLNIPPHGAEKRGQEYLAAEFRALGYEPDLYDIGRIESLHTHPLRYAPHDIQDRWNLALKLPGQGGGRSLILNAHMDTVPPSEFPWKRGPFNPVVEGGRLYGLGSYDMKASLAVMYILSRVLRESGAKLKGDLILESVCDEEDAGVHGTLAQRLRGDHADAAIVLEPSALNIFNMHKGGYFPEMRIEEPSAGINLDAEFIPQLPKMLQIVLGEIERLGQVRKSSVPIPPEYRHEQQPVPVWVSKIVSGLWGKSAPIAIAHQVQLLIYLQTVPGEPLEQVRNQFEGWRLGLSKNNPTLFPQAPAVDFTVRQMEPSSIPSHHPLIRTLAGSVESHMGVPPKIRGSPAPCDMFVFNHHFHIPCAWFGPAGSNAHAPNEYVELESVFDCAKCLLRFLGDWCEWA